MSHSHEPETSQKSEGSSASSCKRAHFIGIGGAGMSGIALVLHERGCAVSGSDLKASHYVRELEEAGIPVTLGHNASTIDEVAPEVVVTSSAIPESNPEVIRARELGIPVWPRAKMLSWLGTGATEVAVAGTHGKTTTSSMIASMLDHMDLDPSFLIGGIVEEYQTNGRNGKGGYFVCEADESDGSFLYLTPQVAVVTNIEADHLDHYGTLENVEKTFCRFMDLVGDAGSIVACAENPHVLELAQSTGRKVVSYGFDPSCDFVCIPGKNNHALASNFSVKAPTGQTLEVCIKANPGAHNMLNATAAIACASVLGLDLERAADALSSFAGAHRRFTHVGDVGGICVVDDYGHHPTEIAATLEAAANLNFKRIVVCFQPHRYSRTQNLAQKFGSAFDQADVLFVMDVFAAGELPIPGVSGRTITQAVTDHAAETQAAVPECHFVPKRSEIVGKLLECCQPGDLLITQGAGDVTLVGPEFIEAKTAQLQDAAVSDFTSADKSE